MKTRYKQKGITLIALVITIILLIILAGISIQAITNTGLFEGASKAEKEAKRAQIKEWLNLKLLETQATTDIAKTSDDIIKDTRQNVNDNINELKTIGKEVRVEEVSTEENGESVDTYFNVQVDEDVFKIDINGPQFIGKVGEFSPVITLESLTKTTNSITIKIKVSKNEEGTLEIYKKAENDTEYTREKVATGEESTGLEYTFSGLEQNKNYSIKIVAIAKNGQTKEYAKDVLLGSVPEGEGKITFSAVTWTNGKASTTISSTETEYTIQYQINSISESGWTTGTSVTGLLHNDKLYARLWDGTNGGTAATNNILDGTDPSASISLSNTSTDTTSLVTATVTHTDNESGINISNCKWVYNTTSSEIGTDESSYTGGTFSSNPGSITLSTTTAGTYYLHVLTTDVAGRTIETISEPVTVEEATKLNTLGSWGQYVSYTPNSNSSSYTWDGGWGSKPECYQYTDTSAVNRETFKWQILDNGSYGTTLIASTASSRTIKAMYAGSHWEGTYYGLGSINYDTEDRCNYPLDEMCYTLYSNSDLGAVGGISNALECDRLSYGLNAGKAYWCNAGAYWDTVESSTTWTWKTYLYYVESSGAKATCTTFWFIQPLVDDYMTFRTSYRTMSYRPIVKLPNNIKITGGSGTSADPFTIGR